MGHWADAKQLAKENPALSISYALDHLKAVAKENPELRPKIEPVLPQVEALLVPENK